MSTYITRAERSGSIFFRVTGLIRSGQLHWSDRPLWYDVYVSSPPLTPPVWNVKMDRHDEPLRKIFYEEDHIRAKFYQKYHRTGIINAFVPGDSISQMFINEYRALKKEEPELDEESLVDKTEKRLEAAGLTLKK
ncbi:unnamed protein product, partial [Mesorhabditis belari]|uniref:Small ribosomal subunit protein mS23 n=1 Tax=Mesorhabditis belari TaxID=2138241 RepID=A0AAF3E8Y5_9BILA